VGGEKPNTGKKCFVIAPIGDPGTEERRKVDALVRSITDTLGTDKWEVVAAHNISESGSISDQIIRHLVEDDLVIADLTGLNRNVMYELGVRHARALPTILLAERETSIPFDIAHERVLEFQTDWAGLREFMQNLKGFVEEAMAAEPDNPVYRVARTSLLDTIELDDAGQVFSEHLAHIEAQLSCLQRIEGMLSRLVRFQLGQSVPRRVPSSEVVPLVPWAVRSAPRYNALGNVFYDILAKGTPESVQRFKEEAGERWLFQVYPYTLAGGTYAILAETFIYSGEQSRLQGFESWLRVQKHVAIQSVTINVPQ